MLLTVGVNGQNSTLIQNKNFRAKELKHRLNKTGDSLLLECARTIYNVEIFNQNYTKLFKIDSTKAKISLDNTPLGRLVVQAKLIDKRIIMTLLRHKELKSLTHDSIPLEIVKTSKPQEHSIASKLNWKPTKNVSKSQKFYWAILESNSNSNSYKSMRLVNEEELFKLIKKNKVEIKTPQGKHNKLTVWEVYNTKKFMEEQAANPDYIFSISSTSFNTTPYYTSIGNARMP